MSTTNGKQRISAIWVGCVRSF